LLIGGCCGPLNSRILGVLWDESPVLAVGAGNTLVSLLLADGTVRVADLGYDENTLPTPTWYTLTAPAPYKRFVAAKCGFFHVALLAS
jgi:hypothetical protein